VLPFDPHSFGPEVARILTADGAGGGTRPMDLYPRACASEAVRDKLLKSDAGALFPGARDPESALSGLFLYFSCLTEAHDLLHHFATLDGAYWHGIMHRMEGDAYNAGYWFRRIGAHPAFPRLQQEAAQLGYAHGGKPGREWDPFAFIRFCEASQGTSDEDLAKRVQLAEWQVLFEYCAAPVSIASRVAAR
jgi:hypothetical protein